jgi:hypothetical protein
MSSDYSLHMIQFPLVFFYICVNETRRTGALVHTCTLNRVWFLMLMHTFLKLDCQIYVHYSIYNVLCV